MTAIRATWVRVIRPELWVIAVVLTLGTIRVRAQDRPSDPELAAHRLQNARLQYDQELARLLTRCGFSSQQIGLKAMDEKTRPQVWNEVPGFTRTLFVVKGAANCGSIVQMFEEFCKQDKPQRIRDLKVAKRTAPAPGRDPDLLDITMTIEVLLPGGLETPAVRKSQPENGETAQAEDPRVVLGAIRLVKVELVEKTPPYWEVELYDQGRNKYYRASPNSATKKTFTIKDRYDNPVLEGKVVEASTFGIVIQVTGNLYKMRVGEFLREVLYPEKDGLENRLREAREKIAQLAKEQERDQDALEKLRVASELERKAHELARQALEQQVADLKVVAKAEAARTAAALAKVKEERELALREIARAKDEFVDHAAKLIEENKEAKRKTVLERERAERNLEKARQDAVKLLADLAGTRAECDLLRERVAQLEKRLKELEKPAEEKKPGNPAPPEKVEGKVTKVDASGLAEISIGSDAGLVKGQKLEVFRLEPKPLYLGAVTVMDVTPAKAVIKGVGNPKEPIKVGDRVATQIVPK